MVCIMTHIERSPVQRHSCLKYGLNDNNIGVDTVSYLLGSINN